MATAWPPWCQWIHTVQYSLNFTEGMDTASRTHAVASILYYQQRHHLSARPSLVTVLIVFKPKKLSNMQPDGLPARRSRLELKIAQ